MNNTKILISFFEDKSQPFDWDRLYLNSNKNWDVLPNADRHKTIELAIPHIKLKCKEHPMWDESEFMILFLLNEDLKYFVIY